MQRARGPALFAVRPIFDSTGTGQPQGWIAFARAFTPAVVERMGRFSPWPVTGFPVSNLDRAGVPEEVREWVRHSPLTSNLKTRTAGRNHLNGYLILRDQVGTPIWLVQLEIPRSAYAQATRTTLYQTILLGLLVGGFTIVAMLLVARSRRLNADRLSLESRYRAIIEQAQDGLLVADARTGEIVDANPAVQQQLGFTLDELRGRSVLSVLRGPNDSQDPVIATLARVEPSRGIELVQWLKDGRQMDVEVSCVPIESRDRRLVSYLMRDLSERKKAQSQLLANQQRLDKLANHDHLTGMPNRLFLQAHLPEAIARCQETGQMLAVLFLDLDRFKHINDSRGHEVGDKLLQEIAKRVRAAVRPADIVVRMGGDEFVVVLHKVNAPDEVGVAATRINEVLSAPVMIDGRALVATVSIGVSLYPARRRVDGRTAQAFGHGDVPGQGPRAKQLPGVLAADGPRAQGTRDHRIVTARRAQAQPVRRALPAHHRHPFAARRRPRGAAALEASDAGLRLAGTIHRSGRGNRPDHSHRAVRARPHRQPTSTGGASRGRTSCR